MSRLSLLLGLVAALAACKPNEDEDGDGLTNKEERELGTDRKVPDSDGDGYTDGQEAHAGTNPTDASSVIYQGGWPYNMTKDEIVDPGMSVRLTRGGVVANFALVDHYGDTVELYDFAHQGKLVLVDISAEWCPSCKMMARWMESGGVPSGSADQQDFTEAMEQYYGPIREAVVNGDIYWITILPEDRRGDPADLAAVQRWHEAFPEPDMPVLADSSQEVVRYFRAPFYPSLYLLDENMVLVRSTSQESWQPPMDAAMELLGQ